MPPPELGRPVHAILADSREDIAGDTVLEREGLRFVGVMDELVEPTFGDEDQARRSATKLKQIAVGRAADNPLLVITQSAASHGGVAKTENVARLLGHGPRVAIDLNDTDGVGQVVEGDRVGCRRGTFRGTN